MKKNIYFLFLAVTFLSAVDLRAQLTFSFSPQQMCWAPGGTNTSATVTTMPSGATSFSWIVSAASSTNCATSTSNTATNGSIVAIGLGTCCGVYSVTCSAYNSSSTLLTSTTNTFSLQCPNWLSVSYAASSSPYLCPGGTATLLAFGGMSYTWIPGNLSGGNVVVSPTVSTCYTVVAINMLGCSLAASACVSVAPSPTLNAAASSSIICQGATTTLNCIGSAIGYTWYAVGPPTFSFTGATMVVTPAASSMYSVVASNGTCISTASTVVLVNPTPTINVAANSTTFCAGSTLTLFAIGANTYSWLSGPTTQTVAVTPTASTCYSVMGQNANGCSTITSICVTLQPGPTPVVGPNPTVCLGSSATLSVSGVTTQTWSILSTANTITVLPLVTTVYSVAGQQSAIGCMGLNTVTVVVDSTCSQVWPGDANSDGLVDNTDVLELGLAYNATGAARTPTSNSWSSQFANNWTGTVSSGKNKCHADCNGDGTINNDDTLAIYNNYSLTHSFRPSESSSANSEISLVFSQGFVTEGVWTKADIMLGSGSTPVNQVYGVAFDVNFDNTLLQSNSAYVQYLPSFLNASNQNVQFRKTDFSSGKVYAASVRVNGNNVSGNGKIGEFWFKTNTGLPANSTLNLSVSNAKKISNTGSGAVLSAGGATLNLAVSPVGVNENRLSTTTGFFPNPAKHQVTLRSGLAAMINYSVCDLTGRELMKGEFTNSKTLDVSQLASGTYFVSFAAGSEKSYKKMVIEK